MDKDRLLDILSSNLTYDFKGCDFSYMDEKDINETLGAFQEVSFENCKFNFALPYLENIKYFLKCEFFEFVGVAERKKFENTYFSHCIFYKKIEFKESQIFSGKIFNFCEFKDNGEKTIKAVKNTFKDGVFYHALNTNIPNIYFETCIFEESCLDLFHWSTYDKIKSIIAIDCTFKNKVFLLNCNDIKKIDFDNSTFKSKVKIQGCKIDYANFYNTKFEDLADFYQTKFINVCFKRTDFKNISVFSEAEFNSDVDFKYTKFLGKAIFRDTIITGKINLRDSIFDDEANFLDSSSDNKIEDKTLKVKNRETARIIKHNFEKLGNKIEANKYHALELKKKKDNLYKKIKDWFMLDKKLNYGDFIDSIVLTLHWLTSLYSTNWLLALFWIFMVSVGTNICLDTNITVESIFKYISILSNIDDFKNSYITMVLNKVSLGYLYYQFLMSVRKDTRK